MHDAIRVARRHWFYVLLPVLLGVSLSFRATYPWNEGPRIGEASTLFDWCVFVPVLYAVCYRHMPVRALTLGILAIACGGAWVAARIVPDHAETLLAQWGWLRGVGMVVLAVFEGLAFMAAMRAVFGAIPDPKLLERHGIPPLFVKMMAAEARFWRRTWGRIRRR